MTTHPSASPVDQQLRDAKARLINASRDMSPTKFVQKHPFVSVGAAAGATFLLTQLAGSSTVRKAAGGATGAIAGPGFRKLIDLATNAAQMYMTAKAAQAAGMAPSADDQHEQQRHESQSR